MKVTGAEVGDSIFLSCGKHSEIEKVTSLARNKIAEDLDLIDENTLLFVGLLTIQCLKKMN